MSEEPPFDVVESPAKLRQRAAALIARAEREPAEAKELLEMAAQYAALADRLDTRGKPG
jgi:hypothetical protein